MADAAKTTAVEVIGDPSDDVLNDKASHTVVVESDEPTSKELQEDEVKYVHGHPVIRNGMDVSRFLVSAQDDGDPAFTFRSIFLGTVFTALSSAVTMLYQFKPVQIQMSFTFLQLLIYIFGEAWALSTPKPGRVNHKSLQRALRFLNSGQPFGIKEHVVSSLIASSGNNGLSGVEVYAVERLFYNRFVSATTAVLATFSISLCGFVLAGVLRPLIIYPSEMVYWSTLPQVVLFQNLHLKRFATRDRLVKFGIALLLSAVWELFPAYIMPWLGGVSIFCLASTNASGGTRAVFGNVFGGASSNEGVGILNFGLDWQYITSQWLSYPLTYQINSWIGYAIFYAGMLGLYYGNVWNAKNFPFMSTSLYTANGTAFNVTSVVNTEGTIDYTLLDQIGLPRLTATAVWGYFTQNAAIGALISHVFLFYGKDMIKAWKQARNRTQPDPHYQGMLRYKEVPMWWYYATFGLCFIAGLIAILKGDTTLSVGAYIIALVLGSFVAPFSCILYGLFGTGVSTNQLSKMVAGAVQPGRPLANLYFASWSHQVIVLAVNLANWLKVGQYTKIPPRVMFWTQVYATLLGAALNYAIMITIVKNQEAILLNPAGNNIWSGTYMQSLNAQAVTWALAKQVYGSFQNYLIVPLGLVIGLAVPPIHWGLTKIFPKIKAWPINTVVIISNAGLYFYGNTSWMWTSMAVGAFAQLYLRPRKPELFNKYNYLIGAALDGGSQLVIFILSFAVYGASGNPRPFPTWWGNPDTNPDHCL